MKAALNYFDQTLARARRLRETQLDALDRAAGICTESIAHQGLVFLFGSGHSRMMCEEMTPRQGCFVGFYAMVELALSNHAATVGINGLRGPLFLEKVEGYAEELLKSFSFGPHDAFIIISTSGIRPVIVEMALGAKARGLPVIGIVSREHCDNSNPAHPSGKKLPDIADVVLDNQCPAGDCVSEIEGLEWRTGPVSTVTGALLINMLRCEVAARLVARGRPPVMLPSHHFVGNTSAEDQLEAYYEAFRKSLAHLYQ
ncbi:MAG: sugar isomerase domain-containing protein [Puniceicoccaceae bacterium]|nr:MAG: sugar isomerase domain-containing protein [Puniceicoccaceae bacterium]